MKKIRIYQLPANHPATFMDLEFVTENDIMPKLSDYNKVYETEVYNEVSLEDLFIAYNMGKLPYQGRSLSVSDVIETGGKFYYCDSYSWEQVNL